MIGTLNALESPFYAPKQVPKPVRVAKKEGLTSLDSNILPGITNLIAGFSICGDFKKIFTAISLKDRAVAWEAGVDVGQRCFAFYGAILQLLGTIGAVFSLPLAAVLSYVAIPGLCVAPVELVKEGIAFKKQLQFLLSPQMQLSRFLEKADLKDPLFFDKLREKCRPLLQSAHLKEKSDHFENLFKENAQKSSQLLNVGYSILIQFTLAKYYDYEALDVHNALKLERRVGRRASSPDVEEKLGVELGKINYSLARESGVAADLEGIHEIFKDFRDQALKKELIHLVGAFTAVVVFTMLALSFFTTGATVGVILLLGVSFLLIAIRYVLIKGVYSHCGWGVDWKGCIPDLHLAKVKRLFLQLIKRAPLISKAEDEETPLLEVKNHHGAEPTATAYGALPL